MKAGQIVYALGTWLEIRGKGDLKTLDEVVKRCHIEWGEGDGWVEEISRVCGELWTDRTVIRTSKPTF